MKITVAIMGHPRRSKSIEKLYKQLAPLPFERVIQVIDINNDEWTTGKRALRAGVGLGDWHIVIQDDAILTPDFYKNIAGIIAALDEKALISLYTGTARPLAGRVESAVAKTPDGGFLEFRQLLWGVGILIPSDHIEPMLEFVEDVALQYDNKIGEFYCRNALPVYYCIPSLVNHNDDLDSLVPGHGRDINSDRRIAHRLATGLVEWQSNTKTLI